MSYPSISMRLINNKFADLMQGSVKSKKFKFHQTDVKTCESKVMELEGK